MPSKPETIQRIAANARIKPALESWVMKLLSEAYDAGMACAEDGAEVWYQVECSPIGQNDWDWVPPDHEPGRCRGEAVTAQAANNLRVSAHIVQAVANRQDATTDAREVAASLVRHELKRVEIESKRYWAKSP